MIFRLDKDIWFPDPYNAPKNYPVAIGGDLSPERLLFAYSLGIFPWYSEDEPILWWCPDPRMVLFPEKLRISRSLKKTLKKNIFTVRFDTAFEEVINRCATVERKDQTGTWLVPEMIDAYIRLHSLGYAHSVEVYLGNRLVGGLYGVSLGGVFFGESMFHEVSDASKVAFVHLVQKLKEWDFDMIDCQQSTEHLRRFGAEDISRKQFLDILRLSLKKETKRGNWSEIV
ncbi:MAG TPA: leucyl/phenylalanyl-tRNA--protein transferase [Persephonella sp.]|uniref:Leucyl/phenylalanyl-tRNA--protein transferase n=1 Tax=Persephonella marina (strain DSM 14350 / EX-H1) TaxID=123214 RepID=C0QS23_PERMH|nr:MULTISPECIES: leucyl/phenylalanyl-tRNA--protein transferase [Persephonella]ACO04454.1 leucyl/phenylalanyl-tRNA--protein transferase [Persephonella marina EX-H1]HCB69214.1 leucyl/phenylalanyl-tRNA--protein transferase [Persephonella sp.]